MSAARLIAKELLKTESVKISLEPPFTWTSGIKSPIYCDNRRLISFPEARELIVSEFMVAIDHFQPEVIAGTATAAIPWAAFVAYKMGLPMVYVRPQPKEHGAGKQIEGVLEMNKKVVLVEDLISTGGSSLRAVEALQNEGQANVRGVVAIMTYQMEKADKAFSDFGMPLKTLTDFEHVLAEVKEEGYLNDEQVQTVLEFRNDPQAWGEKLS